LFSILASFELTYSFPDGVRSGSTVNITWAFSVIPVDTVLILGLTYGAAVTTISSDPEVGAGLYSWYVPNWLNGGIFNSTISASLAHPNSVQSSAIIDLFKNIKGSSFILTIRKL